MFARRFFASFYFPPKYFSKEGASVPVSLNIGTGGPVPYPYPQPPQHIDALARGAVLTARLSLLPGRASGSSEAIGDFVFVGNAIAMGAPINAQRWKLVSGMARAEIELTEEEEFLLMLAEAA